MKAQLQSRSSSSVAGIDGKPPCKQSTGRGPRADLSLPCLRVPQAVTERPRAHASLSGPPSSRERCLVQVCTETSGWWARLLSKAGARSPLPYSRDTQGSSFRPSQEWGICGQLQNTTTAQSRIAPQAFANPQGSKSHRKSIHYPDLSP